VRMMGLNNTGKLLRHQWSQWTCHSSGA
jgi:hypothetical protein